jgi:peptidoglycan/LPS O-acetylase OafA/YrhL
LSRGTLVMSSTNNSDSLRFWAAMSVLWFHAVPISDGDERNELMFRLSRGQTTGGTLAVFVFFAISGYLITRSFERSPSLWHFARARALRIVPALLTVVLLLAFVVGPLLSTLPLGEYFASSEVYRYAQLQSTLMFGWHDTLPGVFGNNPSPWVNGPLWTLRFEVECYVLVFALGVAGLLRRGVTLALFVAALAYLAVFPGLPGTIGAPPEPNPHVELTAAFLAGALIHQWKVQLDGRVAAVFALIIVGCLFSGHIRLAQRTLLPYVTLYLATGATMFRIPHLHRAGDLSYGVYIFAWPVSQLVVQYSGTPSWLQTAAITTPVTLLLASASWHLIEERALALKSSTPRETAPEPSALAHGTRVLG